MPAWSYTALTSFETCPRRHFETRVSKNFREAEGPALLIGNAAHKALENRLAHGTPIPPVIAVPTGGKEHQEIPDGWEGLCQRILQQPGTLCVEAEIALDDRLCVTSWFDKRVWLRCKLDVAILDGDTAAIVDWKTGKRKPDSDQLKLFAVAAMHKWPQLERVRTAFVWLKHLGTPNELDSDEFTRADISTIWDGFVPRVRRLELAHEHNTWPAIRSGLCRNYCPVRTCEHCGR